MRQIQKKKDKDKVAIVLMLCFCVIALTSIFTVKSNLDKINENAADLHVSEETRTEESTTAPQKEEKRTLPSEQTEEVSSNHPTVDSRDNTQETNDYIKPIQVNESKITNPYSMDSLIYSLTLDQYMTHCGIDIEAPEDSQVVAIKEGTVTAIYTDDRYGLSVELTHPGNIISIYSNLSTTEMVEIGDVLKQGDIVGGVGSTALFESLEPSHLHFEMIKDGHYLNPQEYILF